MSGLPTVYIEREPLLSMMLAAVEMYNRECLGYLFGFSSGDPADNFIITSAVQLAAVVHRTSCGLQQSKRACKRLGGFIDKAPKLFPYLADFHSHPSSKMWPGLFGLSEDDRKSMHDEDKFCIIIAIARRTNRILEWTMRDDGTRLRGSLGRFDVHFTAHRVVRDDEGKPVRDESGVKRTECLPLRVAKTTLRALNRASKSKKS
jgi:proteasome lid subunit RPN8/RPN11